MPAAGTGIGTALPGTELRRRGGRLQHLRLQRFLFVSASSPKSHGTSHLRTSLVPVLSSRASRSLHCTLTA
ncbi:hypothetical protein AAFF_G00413150 [Aldrovandia affinis]|uniref:Uncharacterized protein n=1 Tax=Aldrovandia affinis TaxID=143900 RepID=A0AAD7SBI0_9TELE|nr:hypothetical protein AAFF_G00413150 [Aldrovandia affinis]